MNAREVLNKAAYPSLVDNVRRKDYIYYDTQALATGTTEYFFFNTNLGNIFARNKRMPLAGTEVFFVEGISAFLQTPILTTALITALNDLLQQSYLLITVNGRVQCKLPGMDFFRYYTGLTEDATPEVLREDYYLGKRELPIPIILNSTSSVEVKFVCSAAAATAFNAINLRLNLHGIQMDKLTDFYWDDLKNNQFQEITATYYNTVPITTGNETTYVLFSDPSQNQLLWSQSFPLSDIQSFQLQNLEVMVGQPDTPILPSTIYNSRLTNILTIKVDDVEYYQSNLQEKLSVVAGIAGTITDSAAATTAFVEGLNVRQSQSLKIPLVIPAQGKIQITLQQPGSSLGITGNITVAMRGIEMRRVA